MGRYEGDDGGSRTTVGSEQRETSSSATGYSGRNKKMDWKKIVVM